ncbi:MAG: glutamate--tRNA ligase [Candidatus Omnitrophota bacterium]|jgi:glutamyl-tRNA synthetase
MIRVRFAPSPTGYLHIGGVRTALFNYLYARNQQGRFLLRIEDTDRERSKPEYEKEILDALKWLGLGWDEEPLRQSDRLELYRRHAEDLVARGLAYEEKKDGQTAIRFKMPKRKAVFQDLVHGEVEFDTALFEDLIILKSDGMPVYHWACVIDDHETEITHVIRGDDHLSNTPRQILLFEALGWKPPKYGHLPLILGSDGTPLSKRHGAVALKSFKEEGFLAPAILNYLALLGWNSADNQEFFTLEDLVRKFSLKRITKANARFDLEKMQWLNAQHMKKLSEQEFLEQITSFFPDRAQSLGADLWRKLALLYRGRIRTYRDLPVQAAYCFSEIEQYEPVLYRSFLDNKILKRHLEAWVDQAAQMKDFDSHAEVERVTRENAAGWGIEAKDLIHPLRFALTGQTGSPGLFELMSVLGQETCLRRVRKFLGQPVK